LKKIFSNNWQLFFLGTAMLLDCIFSSLLAKTFGEANFWGEWAYNKWGIYGYLCGKVPAFLFCVYAWKRWPRRPVEAGILIGTGIHLATVVIMFHLWITEMLTK